MSKILGPEVGYTDLLDFDLDEKLKKELADRKAGVGKKSHPLRPSSAGFCARRLAYDLMEYRGHADYNRPPIEPHVSRLFDLGHAIEAHALRTFLNMKGFEQRYKQQILTFFPLERADESLPKEFCEGSTDGVFWNDKFKSIMDVKSKKDGFSSSFKTKWEEELEWLSEMECITKLSETAFYAHDLDAFLEELDDDFLTDNLLQLNLYALADFIKDRGVDHAWLYRYCKNDSRHMEVRFKPSEKAFAYVQEKFNAVNKAVDLKRPESVEKEYTLGSMRCAFCPYKDVCWDKDTDALKEWFNTFPRKKFPERINELKHAEELVELFDRYELYLKDEDRLKAAHDRICVLLENEKVYRLKLSNGHIYEMKHLKSPRPHFELRRAKL